jgi:hypothetical protein
MLKIALFFTTWALTDLIGCLFFGVHKYIVNYAGYVDLFYVVIGYIIILIVLWRA